MHAKTHPLVVVIALVAGCGGGPEPQTWENTYQGDGEDAFVTDEAFGCLAEWFEVGRASYKNINGHEEQMRAVALGQSPGPYPVGTIVQAIPSEAMVKRGAGFADDAGDWEFFKLDTVNGRSVITERGGSEVRNPAGSCAACHGKAEARYDFICGEDHGCDPLPPGMSNLFEVVRAGDVRCAE